MIDSKKGAELSINVIIIAIIALVVLVVVIYIFTGQIKSATNATTSLGSCQSRGGQCKPSCDPASEVGFFNYNGCTNQYCCVPSAT